jgi:hypothetical protein
MAEVLEHIDNPVWFLKQIIQNYRKNIGNIIITVPNALGIYAVNNATNLGRESVNIDHRYWFTPYTICNVAHKAGLVPTELHMCLYENSAGYLENNEALLKSKPLLLDTIVLVCAL